MMGLVEVAYRRAGRPWLFRGDPEQIHEQTVGALARLGLLPPVTGALTRWAARHQRPTTVAGVDFPSMVGLAAGMDKNGLGINAWSALGFGHVELGTVTAHPQPGNPTPRLYRLTQSEAIVNRMGFNNRGAQALADRLADVGVWRGNRAAGLAVGVSIGKTKATPLAAATSDYLTSLRLLTPHADYLAVNVSSPNTPGLRSLQDRSALTELITALVGETEALSGPAFPGCPASSPVPIFVKISPDLSEPALDEVVDVCVNAGVRGLIATNTTVSREGVADADLDLATELGGLSGPPLAARARATVHYLSRQCDLPIIGVGGVHSADDGQAMVDAGASLVQVYTGLVYRGPALVTELNRHLGRAPMKARSDGS